MRKRGEVVGAFPGVVMSAALSDDVDAWLKAIHLWSPDAVVAGTAAAKLLGTPDVEVTSAVVHVTVTNTTVLPRPWSTTPPG